MLQMQQPLSLRAHSLLSCCTFTMPSPSGCYNKPVMMMHLATAAAHKCCSVQHCPRAHLTVAEHGCSAQRKTEIVPSSQPLSIGGDKNNKLGLIEVVSKCPAAVPQPEHSCGSSNRSISPLVEPQALRKRCNLDVAADGCTPRDLHAKASCALHIHEEAVGRLHQPLELVFCLLILCRRVQEVDIAAEHLHVKPLQP